MRDPDSAFQCRHSGLAGCAWLVLLLAAAPAGAACFLPRDVTPLLLLLGAMFLCVALLTAAIHRSIAGSTVTAGPRGLQQRSYVIRGPRAELDYSPWLERAKLLGRLLELYASPEARRRDDCAERLGGPIAAWTSGVVGVGERRFTYRTRSLRALVVLLGFIALVAGVAPMLRQAEPPSVYAWIPAGSLGLLWMWALWRYQCGGIRLDELGLTERSIRGDVTLRWAEVETYRKCGSDMLASACVMGAGRRVGFSLYIAEVDTLMREIASRSGHARQCGWSANDSSTGPLP